MEYVQMTLDDWAELNKSLEQDIIELKDNISGMKKGFCKIGYKLRKIEELKLYEMDGYKTIFEFAKERHGIGASDVTRCKQINERYSVGGYSEELQEKYLEFGKSKLTEMLALPDSDMQMLEPEVSRETIRELKRFNKEEHEMGVADDVDQLIEKFYQDNPELRKAVEGREYNESNIKQFAELINPSGNRSYKKGICFLVMYENRVSFKKYPANPVDMTWWQFWQKTEAVLENIAECGGENEEETNREPDLEDNVQPEEEKPGTETQPEENDTREPEVSTGADEKSGNETECEDGEGAVEDHAEVDEPAKYDVEREEDSPCTLTGTEDREIEPQKTIAPAQKNAENQEETPVLEKIMNAPEIVEKPFGTRKDYMDSMTAYGTAAYLVGEYKNNRLNEGHLASYEKMENWLLENVDSRGRTWVDE